MRSLRQSIRSLLGSASTSMRSLRERKVKRERTKTNKLIQLLAAVCGVLSAREEMVGYFWLAKRALDGLG